MVTKYQNHRMPVGGAIHISTDTYNDLVFFHKLGEQRLQDSFYRMKKDNKSVFFPWWGWGGGNSDKDSGDRCKIQTLLEDYNS